jgi:hypothetical protein
VTEITSLLVHDLGRGDFSAATSYFDDTMRSALPPDGLEQAWRSVESQVGPFVVIERVGTIRRDPYRVSFARCRFQRGEKVVRIVYDGNDRVAGVQFVDPAPPLWTPPPYATQSTFEERSVSVGTNPELPGEITLPRGATNVPAVVLVHGSGPHDADATIGQLKVFKDIAWALASRYERPGHVDAALIDDLVAWIASVPPRG